MNSKKITIQELLYNRGLNPKSKAYLVRHKESGLDLYEMYLNSREDFLCYQSQQGAHKFEGLDYIVSFIGEEGDSSRFIGVYKVLGVQHMGKPTKAVGGGEFNFQYDLEEVSGFEALRERVIIKWGKGTRNWTHKLTTEKEVVEIQPGLHYKRFTDYFDFILTFNELSEIVTNEYKDWKTTLTATKGIYLITDTKTGKLYVGSAYREDGIWGRWRDYVGTKGHGGNLLLKALVREDNDYGRHFNFSILMLLPSTVTPDQAIAKESLFKRKLGTRSFGLNKN